MFSSPVFHFRQEILEIDCICLCCQAVYSISDIVNESQSEFIWAENVEEVSIVVDVEDGGERGSLRDSCQCGECCRLYSVELDASRAVSEETCDPLSDLLWDVSLAQVVDEPLVVDVVECSCHVHEYC